MSGPGERPAPSPEVLARRRAALAFVLQWGDPALRARALPVERFDVRLREELERMEQLMDDALGVGLAATQVGVLHRALVYRVPDGPVRALVNPELEWAAPERATFHEGCLSLPGVWVDVERPAAVRVRALDPGGRELRVEAEGVEASIVQHEMDHLDGVLVLDRIDRAQRKAALRALREGRAMEAPGRRARGRPARDAARRPGWRRGRRPGRRP
jgi:peptide deformylase